MDVLMFDIWGDYAHFRQPYSTTSALTYAIPPRTAVLGIIGAIVGVSSGGFGKSEHMVFFEKRNAEVGITPLFPLEKTRLNMNYSYTKADAKTKGALHIQVPVEMVRFPRYRIYFSSEDSDLMKTLQERLNNHESFYTPYLGISELIAQTSPASVSSGEFVSGDVELTSVVYLCEDVQVHLEPDLKMFRETQALRMSEHRHIEEYVDVLYEAECKKLSVSSEQKCFMRIDDRNGELFIMML